MRVGDCFGFDANRGGGPDVSTWRWHCAGRLVTDQASERGGGGGGGRVQGGARSQSFSKALKRSSSTGPSALSSRAW